MRSILHSMVLLFFLSPTLLYSSYRHIALSSPEVCPPPSQASLPHSPSKTLQLDQGTAAVLSLANVRQSYWKCDLEVKASPGHGLMVRVEGAFLRTNTERKGKCVDYVQLGKGDNMPFFTWDKSGKLCGDQTGYSYEVTNGQLLVWVRLGEWQGVDMVKLSMVVTQYRRKDSADLAHYRACNSGTQWVSQEYFCDGRVNCATDISPADESPRVCREEGGVTGDQAPHSPSLPSGPPLNLLSITLVLVSSAVLMFLFVLLLVRVKMSRNCCWTSSALPPNCELPDRAARVGPVSSIPATTTTMYLEPSATTSLVRGTTPDTEPPPAYQDLFPAGYNFVEKDVVVKNSDSLLHKSRGVGKEEHDVHPVVQEGGHGEQEGEVSDVL
eukprot:GFUD01026554.1.p1 GENE.GFUD01026554.1~~GFUD01026554.1.p1  ORF type:complete len:383 (+),score=139.00 GFUD01026554.1:100-1248(+)